MQPNQFIQGVELPTPKVLSFCTVDHIHGDILALTATHECFLIDTVTHSIKLLSKLALPDIDSSNDHDYFGASAYTIHGSEKGDFAAIVIDRGRFGVVVNLATSEVTMRLDGGDYYQETVPFSLSFIRHNNQDLLVHRTDWNRLDISDPSDGRCLTTRFIAEYTQGQRPDHYLDYFHGRITASPSCKRIFDDGWVWHPVSAPRSWLLERWLKENAWESEDGDSVTEFALADDWTVPHCWVDDDTLCLSGRTTFDADKEDSTREQIGVELHSFISTKETRSRSLGSHPAGAIKAILSNGNALAIALDDQTEIWDINTLSMKSCIANFSATHYSKKHNLLISFEDNRISFIEFSDK